MTASFLVKFAGQTVVSLLLGTTPVVLSGPRHVAFFFLGLAVVWGSPGDAAFRERATAPGGGPHSTITLWTYVFAYTISNTLESRLFTSLRRT